MIEPMKKFIYIFCVALLAAACVEPMVNPVMPITDDSEDGPKVTIRFALPPSTKGTMAHNPDISTIHVAVFNQAGLLKQYEKAYLENEDNLINGNNPSGNPTYAVDINMSTKPRILHFIADSPIDTYEELIDIAGTSGESIIMNALTTEDGETAYWQRFVLGRIDAYKYEGGVYTIPASLGGGTRGEAGASSYQYRDNNGELITVNTGDYIKRDGDKVLDGTGYFQSDYVAGMLSNIPFVRNFAEITVSSTTSTNFAPKYFALVNVPTSGYVAPYDANQGAFATAYQAANLTDDGLTHDDIADTGYPGMLSGNINGDMPSSFIDLSSSNKTAYMYERTIPNVSQRPTSILVGGVFDDADDDHKDGNGNTWFKIEIATDQGVYFPIYRGISYNIKIGAITGTSGYKTPEEAWSHDAVGDISGSVETATLTQISDGKGTTLWVEYIDYVATESQNKTILYTMYYQPTAGGAITYLTPDVTLTVNHPNTASNKAIDLDEGSTITGEEYTGGGTPDATKTWYVASVPLKTPGQNTLISTLHVEGTTPAPASKTMYRDVKYRVMGIQRFKNGQNELKATPIDDEEVNRETTLTIYLPNDLGYSMFPLYLMIEAENGHYTTVDGLPVESGPSLFNPDKNAFYFIKTIEYTDYYNEETHATTTAFTTTFKTTHDCTQSGTNETNFRVLDKVQPNREAPYFEPATCHVSVGGPIFSISPAEPIQVSANETNATFFITSRGEDNPEWNVSVDNDATLSQSSGQGSTGSQGITVSIPANSTANTKTYTVTATREGWDTQTLSIQQAGAEFQLTAQSTSVNPDETSTSFNITSTGSASGWSLSVNNGATLSTSSGEGSVSGITVNFPARNNSKDPKTYTITATRNGWDQQELTITQNGLTLDLDGVTPVNATQTSTTFSISPNSSTATWQFVELPENVSITRNGNAVTSGQGTANNLVVNFPQNMSRTDPVTYTIKVKLGDDLIEQFVITQAARSAVERSVTFNTNNGNGNFNGNRTTRTTDGVTLTFSNNTIRSRSSSYLALNDGGQFVISSESTITAITINYTSYDYGRSGYNNNYSSANPAPPEGTYVYATNNGTTGQWTGNSTSITFTMYGTDSAYTRISSIVVTYLEEQ